MVRSSTLRTALKCMCHSAHIFRCLYSSRATTRLLVDNGSSSPELCNPIQYLMFIGPCIVVIVEERKTNLMSLATLFHFLCAQHVSDINISIIRSLRLCCWITTSVVLFCKDGGFSVSVNLLFLVVCVWCDVFCRFVVVGRCILIDFDRYLLCFVIIVCACVWYVYIGCMAQLVLQPAKRAPPKTSRTKSPTHKELRTRRPMW